MGVSPIWESGSPVRNYPYARPVTVRLGDTNAISEMSVLPVLLSRCVCSSLF